MFITAAFCPPGSVLGSQVLFALDWAQRIIGKEHHGPVSSFQHLRGLDSQSCLLSELFHCLSTLQTIPLPQSTEIRDGIFLAKMVSVLVALEGDEFTTSQEKFFLWFDLFFCLSVCLSFYFLPSCLPSYFSCFLGFHP